MRQLDGVPERVPLLQRIPIFSSLRDEELEQLASVMHRRTIKAGKDIVVADDAGESMFIMVEGLAHVFINTEHRDRLQVGELAPGTFFGEMSLSQANLGQRPSVRRLRSSLTRFRNPTLNR